MTNVLIIDDHEVVRAGLILVLRSQFQPKLIKEAGNEKQSLGLIIILPKFETRELVNNFRNLTISNEKANTQKIRSSLQSHSCS